MSWSIEADYVQACNCDYGCPCEFEAPPTLGYCQGLGAYRITRGQIDDVKLDGLGFAFVIDFPGPMHKGNGRGGFYLDEKADARQRVALERIVSGAAGGMPFEVFKMLLSKVAPAQFVPIEFNLNGRNSSVRVGQAISVAVEPIKNPITGEDESIRIEHGTGFIFKGADCVSARVCKVDAGEISFDWPNKAGFVTRVLYSGG